MGSQPGTPPAHRSTFHFPGGLCSNTQGELTASIQAKYQQPPLLSDDLEYAVHCELVIDELGCALRYRLINSSGSLLFDQSALDALSKVAESASLLPASLLPAWIARSS